MSRDVVFAIAKRRSSIRDFLNEKVLLEDVLYAISTALQAPSGANRQPWRYIIIEDETLKSKIRKLCENAEKKFYESNLVDWFKEWVRKRGISWKKPFLTEAPYLIAVFADIKAPYAKESVWLAIGYLLLALEEKRLSSLTYTPPNFEEIRTLLGVPKGHKLETIIPVGKKAKEKIKEPRMEIKDVVYINKWGEGVGYAKS